MKKKSLTSIVNRHTLEPLLSHFIGKGIPAEEAAQITEAFHTTKISKGNFFVEEGRTSKYLAFITRGLFQYYYLRDGKEITTYVSGENTFLLSVISFFKQQPSKEFIKALEEAELLTIHYDDLLKLKNKNNAFRSFYIKALENLAVGMDETRTNLIILTAEERYDVMMKKEPQLLQRIPLQYLASILGVTPRHLSRIRSKYS